MINLKLISMTKQDIGLQLKKIREDKKISTYKIIKSHKLRFEAIKAIEEGSSNYTIDNLLKYLDAIGCVFCVNKPF